MLLRLLCVGLLASTAFADKPADVKKDVKITKANTVTNEIVVQNEADDRSDVISEKVAAAPVPPVAGTPVSQGNLYYYYYPVAAYPVHASDKVSSSGSSGASDILSSPLIYILVPLLLLLLAVPLLALTGVNTSSGRSFDARNSALDEKFGSFAELQEEVDRQLTKYMAALDSENCMDRIVCELGVKASNVPSKELFFRYVKNQFYKFTQKLISFSWILRTHGGALALMSLMQLGARSLGNERAHSKCTSFGI
jgi:hypothetical protein